MTKWILREAIVTYKSGEKVLNERVASSATVCRLMHSASGLAHIPQSPVEHFVIFALNSKNEVISYEVIAKGGQASCVVDPTAVFRGLILQCALAFVAVHNHPSGDVHPSSDDMLLTQRLEQAAELLGIRFLDHVIVGHNSEEYFSFLDAGLMTKK